jgi:Xaa-Pro aminopeptidase
MLNRIRTIQASINPKEAWLISNQVHIEYLTGFKCLIPTEREGFLWITKSNAALIYSTFSPPPDREDIIYFVGCNSSQLINHLAELIQLEPIEIIVIDGATLWHDEFRALSEANLKYSASIIEQKKHQISGSGSSSVAISGEATASFTKKSGDPIVLSRAIKDGIEQQAIAKASQFVAQAIADISQKIQPGMTEEYVCQQIEVAMRAKGSTQPAFPTIVAFGENTALPHHQPGSKVLAPDMAILIDCGATVDRYKSDMTRSWWFGSQKPAEYQKIESIVLESYASGIKTLSNSINFEEVTLSEAEKINQKHSSQIYSNQKNGLLTAQKVDDSCRMVIQKSGYGPMFIHTTGHGVGLDIHEDPSIDKSNSTTLKPGMVITIEPGIYLKEKFGFRYENTLILT